MELQANIASQSTTTAELLMVIEDELDITVPGDLRITGDTTVLELAKMMKGLT